MENKGFNFEATVILDYFFKKLNTQLSRGCYVFLVAFQDLAKFNT